MVTGLMSASARRPKEMACGAGEAGGAGLAAGAKSRVVKAGGGVAGARLGSGGARAGEISCEGESMARARGVRAGGSSGSSGRAASSAPRALSGAAAAASASAKGAAAAAAVPKAVTGSASTTVRGMDCHMETGWPESESEGVCSGAIGRVFLRRMRPHQPKRPPSSVVGSAESMRRCFSSSSAACASERSRPLMKAPGASDELPASDQFPEGAFPLRAMARRARHSRKRSIARVTHVRWEPVHSRAVLKVNVVAR